MKKILLAAFLTCFMCILCVIFVDRQLVNFINTHVIPCPALFECLTELPVVIGIFSLGCLAFYCVWRLTIDYFPACLRGINHKFMEWIEVMGGMGVAALLGFAAKAFLKIVFGRYSVMVIDPSWIHNRAYGFHFFHMGDAYKSFPSGHTTVMVSMMTVLYLCYPRVRVVPVLLSGLLMVSLMLMNYHFLSDVIAGAFVGGLVGMGVVDALFGKRRPSKWGHRLGA